MLTRAEIFGRRDEIIAIAQRYGASEVRIFGSFARGDHTEGSDLDVLVRLGPGRSLLDQGGLLMDLRDLLASRWMWLTKGRSQGGSVKSSGERLSRYEIGALALRGI